MNDYRQLYLARVLCVGVADLFPMIDPQEPIDSIITELMEKRRAR